MVSAKRLLFKPSRALMDNTLIQALDVRPVTHHARPANQLRNVLPARMQDIPSTLKEFATLYVETV
jgi:hypothetical protein